MCRLFGISYGPGGPEAEVYGTKQLAVRMYRELVTGGQHAHGWMAWTGDDRIHRARRPGRSDAADIERWVQSIPDDCRWFVGHTRYATTGSPENNANNHPLVHGPIVGVHNGKLQEAGDRGFTAILERLGRHDPNATVDSEAIFASVLERGPVEGLRQVRGTMVTLFADARSPQELYLGRSYGKDVFLGWTEAGSLVWASTSRALDLLEKDGWVFTKRSTVTAYRLLKIVDGDIVERVTYDPESKERGQESVRARRLAEIDAAIERQQVLLRWEDDLVFLPEGDAADAGYCPVCYEDLVWVPEWCDMRCVYCDDDVYEDTLALAS